MKLSKKDRKKHTKPTEDMTGLDYFMLECDRKDGTPWAEILEWFHERLNQLEKK